MSRGKAMRLLMQPERRKMIDELINALDAAAFVTQAAFPEPARRWKALADRARTFFPSAAHAAGVPRGDY